MAYIFITFDNTSLLKHDIAVSRPVLCCQEEYKYLSHFLQDAFTQHLPPQVQQARVDNVHITC